MCACFIQIVAGNYVLVLRTSTNMQDLCLYGSISGLYGIGFPYWMKLKQMNFSFPYLIYAYMEEAILGFWKGSLSWEWDHIVLRVARGMGHASSWFWGLEGRSCRKGQWKRLLKLWRCSKLLLSSFVSCVTHSAYLLSGARLINGLCIGLWKQQ